MRKRGDTYLIEALTGISNAMIRSAPSAGGVMRDVSDFVGDMPIVAHNASFDAKFWYALRRSTPGPTTPTWTRRVVCCGRSRKSTATN